MKYEGKPNEKPEQKLVTPDKSLSEMLAASVKMSLEETEALVDRAYAEKDIINKINMMLDASKAFLAHKESKKALELIRQAEKLYEKHKVGIDSNTDRIIGNIGETQSRNRKNSESTSPDQLRNNALSRKLRIEPGEKISPEELLEQ